MALKLVLKYSRKIINQESFLIPMIFKSEYLIILASCQDCRVTWHKAGYLSQYVDTLPLRKVQVSDSKLILLNSPVLQSFALHRLGYQLKFDPVDWIKTIDLQVYEPNMSLYQSESSATNAQDVTSQSVPALFALTVAPTAVLPANTSRKGILVRNKGVKQAALGFDAGLTLANAPYIIPAGATLEIIEDF
ncbi:MAG: hypothetical protein ACRC06_11330, partial [Waterburya sp.]